MLLRDVMSAGSEHPQVSSPERARQRASREANGSLPDKVRSHVRERARPHQQRQGPLNPGARPPSAQLVIPV